MIHGWIPTPEKHKTTIIPLENDSYSIKKPPTDSSSNFLGIGTSRMKNISLPELKSKEKDSYPSSIGVESSQVSTENDHLSKVISKPAPE